MNTTPRVSIGIPVFNGDQFLEEVLDSILTQSFEDFELIISDNASTDRTAEICKVFATTDERIRYYRSETNIGAARNYNRVFNLSVGAYFKWAAADDLCAPNLIERCVKVLDSEKDVVLCYPKTTIIDDNGENLRQYEDGLNMTAKSASGRFIQVISNCRLCNAVMGLIRSSAMKKTRLIKDYIGCDKVLLAELSFLGKFREVPEYLFFRRFHAVLPEMSNAKDQHYGASFVSRSENKQLEWLDPDSKNIPGFSHWRRFKAYITAICRAPVGFSQKIFPLVFICGSLFANNSYRLEIRRGIEARFRRSDHE